MTLNFPGPYELRFFYTADISPGGVLQHQLRYSVELEDDPDVGEDFANINILLSGGGTETADQVVLDTWNVIEDFMSAADNSLDTCELWKYTEGTFDATYVAVEAVGLAGVDVGGGRAAGECIWTMRTRAGGIFKIHVLEGATSVGPPVAYADANQENQDLWDYFCHPTLSPAKARDGSAPVAPLRYFPGSNEHLFKVRYGR